MEALSKNCLDTFVVARARVVADLNGCLATRNIAKAASSRDRSQDLTLCRASGLNQLEHLTAGAKASGG